MTTNLTDLATTLQTLFTTDADDLAYATGFVQRRRKLTGAVFAQTTVFGWLHDPHASLADLTELATQLGAPVTPSALDQRFRDSAVLFLQALLAHALTSAAAHTPIADAPNAPTLLDRFTAVALDDSTTISLPPPLAELFPGCGGSSAATHAALKVPVRLELRHGTLEIADLMPGRRCDLAGELPHTPLPAGSLRLADLGYFSLQALQEYDRQQVYILSRLPARTTLWADGRKWQVHEFLQTHSGKPVDCWVEVGGKLRLRLRLIAWRVGAEVLAKRLQRLQRRAQRSGRPVSVAQRELAGWNVVLTNAPEELLGWREACILARLRWQVEWLFRLWKSAGGLDESAATKPERVLCELLAKLLGLVVQHWALLSAGPPLLQQSQVRAAKRVRAAAEDLAVAVAGPVAKMVEVLEQLQQRLRQVVGKQKRRGQPAAFQLAENPFDLEYFYMPAA